MGYKMADMNKEIHNMNLPTLKQIKSQITAFEKSVREEENSGSQRLEDIEYIEENYKIKKERLIMSIETLFLELNK